MKPIGISLIADDETVDNISRLATREGIRCSRITAINRTDTALHSPLGGLELPALLSLISLIFSTGSSVLIFIDKLRQIVKKPHIELRDAKTGKLLIVINETTTNEAIKNTIGPP